MGTPYQDQVEAWRANRLKSLRAPEGWLSVAGLSWLHGGSNSVGSDGSCDVVLPDSAPARAGTIEVADGRAILRAEMDAGLLHEGEPFATLVLNDDAAAGPTRVRVGPVSFHLIRREGELAVRVRDRDRAARIGFHGIAHYPVDAEWCLRARLQPETPPREVVVPAMAGPGERYAVPGTAVFDAPRGGGERRLTAFEERPGDDLFFVFGDRTNGRETYGGGRFMYATPPGPDGTMVLDFNRAYNPPCVFTPFATCPLPLPANRLDVRVEAGELKYREGSTERADEPNP